MSYNNFDREELGPSKNYLGENFVQISQGISEISAFENWEQIDFWLPFCSIPLSDLRLMHSEHAIKMVKEGGGGGGYWNFYCQI